MALIIETSDKNGTWTVALSHSTELCLKWPHLQNQPGCKHLNLTVRFSWGKQWGCSFFYYILPFLNVWQHVNGDISSAALKHFECWLVAMASQHISVAGRKQGPAYPTEQLGRALCMQQCGDFVTSDLRYGQAGWAFASSCFLLIASFQTGESRVNDSLFQDQEIRTEVWTPWDVGISGKMPHLASLFLLHPSHIWQPPWLCHWNWVCTVTKSLG